MKKYTSFFKIRFLTGMQYRAAALGGLATQFAWGGLTLLLFYAFYQTDSSSFPMTFEQLASYIWLQQAFLTLYMNWYFDEEIFDTITTGNISYELARPIDLYAMWFTKNLATRVSRAVLRCVPILVFASLLPEPFALRLPSNLLVVLPFVLSSILGLFVIVSFTMLIYISAIYTLSARGLRILTVSALEFFTGALVPIPFFPEWLQPIINILPFASIQSTPFLIYVEYISVSEVIPNLLVQIAWLIALTVIGKLIMNHATQKVEVQGG